LTLVSNAAFAAVSLAMIRQKWVSLSREQQALRACREHHTYDRSLPAHNPNLCETCIGDAMPMEGVMVANTGVCGNCERVDEVWDLDHLEQLRSEGFVLDADVGIIPARNPLRCSHVPRY